MSLIELESLQEAICIVNRIRVKELSAGSITLWRLLLHAERHLDQRLASALAPEAL
jgi:hypothetical protein